MNMNPRRVSIQQIRPIHAALLFGLIAMMPFLPFMAEGARKEREPLDLTILERQAEITQKMSRSERIQLARIEAAISEAKSDKRSGQFMVDAKPSTVQPNRDVKAINEEGKKVIERAEVALYENRKALVELLETVENKQNSSTMAEDIAFDLELDIIPYNEAAQRACEQILEACWEKGYGALFYHEVFIRDPNGMRRASSVLRNEIYDRLARADGTNFTVNLPIDLRLKPDATGVGNNSFTFESESAFERDKKALLVFEVIVPKNSDTCLLSVRAINMATHRIAAAELFKITDFPDLLDPEEIEAPTDQTVQKIELRGGAKNIQRVANSPADYRFKLQTDSVDRQSETLILHTLFRNSDLSIVDSDFIKEAYGADLTEPENWQGRANGRILVAGMGPDNSYEIGFQVEGAERVLPAGKINIFREDPE
ncbi:MAG: hypothetical protein GVY36_09720 [Verrucomicrobia bacterium]|jgi:hypothetical protein|nr:hypothetical protein [Verrucomicrobiota bacterium]